MSASNQTTPEPATEGVADFSARFSPMLVKELRQGMRTNLFAIAFILLHSFMILVLLAAISNPQSNDADGFFWFVIISVLLFVQPLRGFSALTSEYQLNTMDLIQLTRLNGWRITFGKWTALNAQSLLFVAGVLPYLVIRYFLGNVNFIVDLLSLGLIGLGSALATAITVGCSAFKNVILRGALIIGLGFALSILIGIMADRMIRRGFTGLDQWLTLGLVVLACLYGCFFFLSFGASRIAPLSENHATRKRLGSLTAALASFCFIFAGLPAETVVNVACIILGMAVVDAVTEPLPIFQRVLKPFSHNPLSRIAALFFSPGWISGLGFWALCSLLLFVAFYFAFPFAGSGMFNGIDDVVALLSGCNIFIFPLIIIHLFFPKYGSERFSFALYAGIQGILFGITIMVTAIANAMGRWEELVYSLVPLPSILLVAYEDQELDNPQFPFIAITTTLLAIAVPLIRHRSEVKEFLIGMKPQPKD